MTVIDTTATVAFACALAFVFALDTVSSFAFTFAWALASAPAYVITYLTRNTVSYYDQTSQAPIPRTRTRCA